MPPHARDHFEQYFAEKIWEMIPVVYREEDARGTPPGVLRSLLEVLAEQAARLRRSNDRLWEDQFIEHCSNWAIPYIGKLVGTRLVGTEENDPRSERSNVAKTIYYRRRKGTLRILEELISDIAGWEGKVVEEFRRLARARHSLDPNPTLLKGRFTSTCPGGFADLRRRRGAELAISPFSEFHFTPDLRQGTDAKRRYGIHKIGFHLYRIPARRLVGVTAHPGPTPGSFLIDPSARNIQMFNARNRSEDWDQWRSAREWELPGPMRCRVLGHAEYRVSEPVIQQLIHGASLPDAAADELRSFRGVRFSSQEELRNTISTFIHSAAIFDPSVFDQLLADGLVDDCGKSGLLPKSFHIKESSDLEVLREHIHAGNLSSWNANISSKRVVVDPELGRLLFIGSPPLVPPIVTYYYGFSGEIGAGSYDRGMESQPADISVPTGGGPLSAGSIPNNGVTQFSDSATYGPLANKSGVVNFILRSANQQRPYLRLESNWVLDTGVQEDSSLLLEGLWIGASGNFSVVLRGDYEKVTIRHSTLDPGGKNAMGNTIDPVVLIIEGRVEHLIIDRSILGPIRTQGTGFVGEFTIQDSFAQSIVPGVIAIDLPRANAIFSSVTIFGAVNVNRLEASEVLVTDHVDVTNTQDGCFRFSAAPTGSRVPQAYESHEIDDSFHMFNSRRFGHSGFGQLSKAAPLYLMRGGENGSEIGAFNSLLNPIKLDSLRTKVEEFLPFGLVPLFICET